MTTTSPKHWTHEEIARAVEAAGDIQAGLEVMARAVKDLIAERAERDAAARARASETDELRRTLAAERKNTEVLAQDYAKLLELSHQQRHEQRAASTWRLPDWLGGHPVTLREAVDLGSLGPHVVAQVHGSDVGAIVIQRADLVEVRPPSIDDPSKWPLTITHGDTSLRLDTDHHAPSGCAVIDIDVNGRVTTALHLTEQDLWELAKSAAQHVKGRRRFAELHAGQAVPE